MQDVPIRDNINHRLNQRLRILRLTQCKAIFTFGECTFVENILKVTARNLLSAQANFVQTYLKKVTYREQGLKYVPETILI